MAEKRLNKKQLEYFKKELFKIKEDILHDIKNMHPVNSSNGENLPEEPSAHGMHMADAATDMYDREFNLNLASNDREILNKVDAALKRIKDGTYGICLKTKKSIPLARLKALPYAEYTREAQEEIEKNSHR